jgi:hypothetical protein
MRPVKLISVIGLVFLSISLGSAAGPSSADVTDLGDVCIGFSYDNVGLPPFIIKYGVLVYGTRRQHILLTATGAPEHGFAILTGDQIVVTLNGTSVAPDASTIFVLTSQMVLNASTLRGPLTTIGTSLSPIAAKIICQ